MGIDFNSESRYKQPFVPNVSLGHQRKKKIKIHHKEGIVCKEPGCVIRLSIYNAGKYCSLHEEKEKPKEKLSVGKLTNF